MMSIRLASSIVIVLLCMLCMQADATPSYRKTKYLNLDPGNIDPSKRITPQLLELNTNGKLLVTFNNSTGSTYGMFRCACDKPCFPFISQKGRGFSSGPLPTKEHKGFSINFDTSEMGEPICYYLAANSLNDTMCSSTLIGILNPQLGRESLFEEFLKKAKQVKETKIPNNFSSTNVTLTARSSDSMSKGEIAGYIIGGFALLAVAFFIAIANSSNK